MSANAEHQDADFAYREMLLRKLLHAFYWVDDGLQAHMQSHAGFSLPRAQSMMMACIADGVQRQSEMARYLRVSKQAVQQALRALMDKGLVVLETDPASGRHKIVTLTPKGREMRDIAQEGVRCLEVELGRRIGLKRLAALHDALDPEWGPPPDTGMATRSAGQRNRKTEREEL